MDIGETLAQDVYKQYWQEDIAKARINQKIDLKVIDAILSHIIKQRFAYIIGTILYGKEFDARVLDKEFCNWIWEHMIGEE